MLRKIIVAGATVVAMSAPGLAANSELPMMQATSGSWNVLKDASTGQCYAANRAAGPSETLLGGNFGTEQAAQGMISRISTCDPVVQNSNNS
jgi:hypothetical protein